MNQPCLIELLGGLAIHHGDRTIVRFRTQKTAALLAYLAYYLNRSHPREEIVELLWPDTELEDGRASLRTALASLRHQLEPPGTPHNSVLVADRLNVRLNAQVVSTDVSQFESALLSARQLETAAERVGMLSRAVELYRGPLLPGTYEDWALRERERLEQSYINTLEQLSKALAEAGDLGKAIDCALRRVHTDTLVEEAHVDLIRLYLSAGQANSARAQYDEMERIFRKELGAAPSSAAQALLLDLPEARTTIARAAPTLSAFPHLGVHSVAPASATSAGPPPLVEPPLQAPRLPLYLAPFFGREEEIARLVELISRESTVESGGQSSEARAPAHSQLLSLDSRLVTLTGPGGTGKTRLAVEAAKGLEGAYRGRIWLVPLADIVDAGLILDAVLVALCLTQAVNQEPLDQVAQFLGDAPSLLILDNFEQLVEAGAPVVWALLERIPGLVCLVTSRQRLDLAGEREFPVRPLPVPAAPGTPERLLEFPSVVLFVDRAQAARSDFQLTRDNAAFVAALCERVEGIPLAIELAAAWSGVLTPAQMVARLGERFTFLASRRKGLHARQRSLRDTVEWSYRLLTTDLQRFFARLSAFRGGWTLDAAEAVCDDPDALDRLTQLRERSLVVSEETGSEMRFRLLETLREYAAERLAEFGETEAVRERHLAHYLGLAEAAATRCEGPAQTAALATLETEHDNLRAALTWSRESGVESRAAPPDSHDSRRSSIDSERGLRLAIALTRFWDVRGHLSEGRRWLADLLAADGRTDPSLRARALLSAGSLAWPQAEYAEARAFLNESLSLFRQCDDRQGIADALHGLGIVAEEEADYTSAIPYLEESIAIKRELGDRHGVAASLNTLANAVTGHGEYARARYYYTEALAIRRELDDKRGITIALNNLAIVAYELGEYAESRALLEETLPMRRELGDQRGIAICLNNLSELALQEGDGAAVRRLQEEAIEIRQQLGDRHGVASSLLQLANLAASQGDPAGARALFLECLTTWRDLANRRGILECLEKLASLATSQGDSEHATRLFGAADTLREALGTPVPPNERGAHEAGLATLRSRVPGERFAAAWHEGQAMTLEEAIACALGQSALY